MTPTATDRGPLVAIGIREPNEKYRQTKLFRGLLEAAPDGMVIVNRDGAIVLVNAQVEELFGYRRAELVGEQVEILVPDRYSGMHMAFRNGYVSEPRTRPMGLAGDLHARRKDGSEFPIEVTLSPLETDEGLLVSAAIRDISERRRMQEETDRVKDEFFATVSHELRTPLTSIVGYLEVLADGGMGPLDDSVSQGVAIIERNVGRLRDLVEDLLTLSAYDAAQVHLDLRPTDLEDVVADCHRALAPAIHSKQLEVTVHSQRGLPPALADRTQIERVVLNLLSNATKFSHRGARVTIDLHAEGPDVVLTVVDTGIGIPAEEQERLFSRFFRSSLAMADEIQGTGLGLTLVQAVVDWHDGTVLVDSVEGEGTTVTVRLPQAR
jgi:protein-histidine pros-kinase